MSLAELNIERSLQSVCVCMCVYVCTWCMVFMYMCVYMYICDLIMHWGGGGGDMICEHMPCLACGGLANL